MASKSMIPFFCFLLIGSAIAEDITEILSPFGDYSTFTKLLADTKIADEISSRQTITVLVLDNSAVSAITSLPQNAQKQALSVHVILDYYDPVKLDSLKDKTTLLTTLFQASGQATGQMGFIKYAELPNEQQVFGSVPGAQINSNLIKVVAARPYNISVMQVSAAIIPPGLGGATKATPPTPSAQVPPPAQSNNSTSPSSGNSTAPSSGNSTPPSSGNSTSPSSGNSTPPSSGNSKSPSAGNSTAPPAGNSTSPSAGNATSPSTGKAAPPPTKSAPTPSGSATPPPTKSATPPANNAATPPPKSSASPPTKTVSPSSGNATPPTSGEKSTPTQAPSGSATSPSQAPSTGGLSPTRGPATTEGPTTSDDEYIASSPETEFGGPAVGGPVASGPGSEESAEPSKTSLAGALAARNGLGLLSLGLFVFGAL